MTTREWLDEHADATGEEILTADGFDDAILGVTKRVGKPTIVVYDRDRCVAILMERYGVTEEEAVEYFEFNTAGAWVGEGTPCFLVRPDAEEI